jgi:hypothetical protein
MIRVTLWSRGRASAPSIATLLLTLILCMTVVSALAPGLAKGQSLVATTCEAPANLSIDKGQSFLPEEASDPVAWGSNVYIAWTDKTLGNNQIYFAASHNNGSTFGSTIDLSNNLNANDGAPRVAAVKDHVYVVWLRIMGGNLTLLFAASQNNGTTFGTTIMLGTEPTTHHNSAPDQIIPQIAAYGTDVYAEWTLFTGARSNIFFFSSHNSGSSFGPAKQITRKGGLEFFMGVNENNVYLVWNAAEIGGHVADVFISSSHDNGTTFSTPVNLSNDAGTSVEPMLAAGGSDVYVVWKDVTPGNWDVFIAYSHDNGSTFSAATNLSNNPGISREVTVAMSGDNVYVIWRDNTPGTYDTFVRVSHDNGASFGSTVNLSGDSGIVKISNLLDRPYISAYGSNVYAIWDDDASGAYNVYISTSENSGKSFDTPINLSNQVGVANGQTFTTYLGNSYVAWDQGPTSRQPADVYFARCTTS